MIVGLLEGTLVELLLFVKEEHLVFFSCQRLCQLYNPVFGLSHSDDHVSLTHGCSHGDEILQVQLLGQDIASLGLEQVVDGAMGGGLEATGD